MSKQILFEDDSEEEVALKTENTYAKKYDQWREKEEIHKLEQKYGSKALSSDASASSDSEDESDEPPEISEETETQFLKTLALLKTKDPRIYDPSYTFFDEKEKEIEKETKTKTLTFEDSDEDDDGGDIFSIEKKAEIVDTEQVTKKSNVNSNKNAKEGKLKEYLTGKAEHIDEEVEQDLAPLKALWSDPKLNEGEAFLRDYILNKDYLDDGDIGEAADKIRDDDDLEADEKMVEEQGKFERAYNFRFEEPDEEYLKRFPRTMNYIRPKDESRARARAELRARKQRDKQRKMDDIARLKALKLNEIQEKLARIKEVTGNDDLAFKDEDIEGDFNPEEHDRRMKAIFDEQYYGDVDEEKPVFPDLDEELEIENWENYEPEHEDIGQEQSEDGPHCEDEDFNMDADYNPRKARENLLEQIQSNLGKKRRNRKKKSKLAEVLSTDKPKFVPTVVDKTYDQYMEEYYKMDCEDIIGGDLPTRFKYREVVPCDYGLTIEEILLADDKELTQWVPLKTIVKHRPANIEKGEVKTYAHKAADVTLMKKVLPSLFKDLPEHPEIVVPLEEATKKKKKKKKKTKNKDREGNAEVKDPSDVKLNNSNEAIEDIPKKKIHKRENNNEQIAEVNKEVENNKDIQPEISEKSKQNNIIAQVTEDEVEKCTVVSNQEIKKKKKKEKNQHNGFIIENVQNEDNVPCQIASTVSNEIVINKTNNQKVNLKRKLASTEDTKNPKKKKTNKNKGKSMTSNLNMAKKKKDFKMKFKPNVDRNKEGKADNPLNKLSDERLKAYGLNPKKYRSFLKYKKF